MRKLAAGGISNLYYPPGDRGASLTFENALFNTGMNAVRNLFQELVVRKLTPRVPNYGAGKPSGLAPDRPRAPQIRAYRP